MIRSSVIYNASILVHILSVFLLGIFSTYAELYQTRTNERKTWNRKSFCIFINFDAWSLTVNVHTGQRSKKTPSWPHCDRMEESPRVRIRSQEAISYCKATNWGVLLIFWDRLKNLKQKVFWIFMPSSSGFRMFSSHDYPTQKERKRNMNLCSQPVYETQSGYKTGFVIIPTVHHRIGLRQSKVQISWTPPLAQAQVQATRLAMG